MKMSFKIKTMLAVNVQAHTNRFRQRLLEILKKKQFPGLHSRTYFCCDHAILATAIFCRIGQTFEAEPIKFP